MTWQERNSIRLSIGRKKEKKKKLGTESLSLAIYTRNIYIYQTFWMLFFPVFTIWRVGGTAVLIIVLSFNVNAKWHKYYLLFLFFGLNSKTKWQFEQPQISPWNARTHINSGSSNGIEKKIHILLKRVMIRGRSALVYRSMPKEKLWRENCYFVCVCLCLIDAIYNVWKMEQLWK